MARIKYDVVWYWFGNAGRGGEWRGAEPADIGEVDIAAAVVRFESAGFPAVAGLRSIGPPEGPPSPHRRARRVAK